MSQRIIMIDHVHATRDDRASELLAARGYTIDWRRPADGDPLPAPDRDHVAAVVHGGLENISESQDVGYIADEIAWTRRWVESGKPYLGLCLGGQILASAFDAAVGPHPEGLHEIGFVPVFPTEHATGFLDEPLHVYEWHQECFQLPEQATLLATGEAFPHQAFKIGKHAYGFQFHPEVSAELLLRWVDSSPKSLQRPGAHDRERQARDSERFVPAMTDWMSGFFERWLGPSAAVSTAPPAIAQAESN